MGYIDTVSSTVITIIPIVAVMLALVMWFKMRRIGPVAGVLVGSVVVMFIVRPSMLGQLSAGITRLFDELFVGTNEEPSDAPAAEEEPAPTSESTSEPTPTPSEPAIEIDWGLVGQTALSLVVVIALALALARFGPHLFQTGKMKAEEARKQAEERERKRVEEQARREEVVRRWGEYVAQADKLIARWLKWTTDVDLMLKYPLMKDLDDPLVRKAADDFLTVRSLYREEAPESVASDDEFPRAVRTLSLSLDHAEDQAKKVRLRNFPPEERKRIHQAEKLLARARDAAASEHERRLCYERAMKTLDGLMNISTEVVEAVSIEAREVLAIEAAPRPEEPAGVDDGVDEEAVLASGGGTSVLEKVNKAAHPGLLQNLRNRVKIGQK